MFQNSVNVYEVSMVFAYIWDVFCVTCRLHVVCAIVLYVCMYICDLVYVCLFVVCICGMHMLYEECMQYICVCIYTRM